MIIRVTKMPPTRGYRLKGPLAAELGPLFVALAGGIEDAEGNRVPWSVIETDPVWQAAFLRAVIKHLEESDEAALVRIVAECVEGCAAVLVGGEYRMALSGTVDEVVAMFDQVFGDVYELIKFGIEVVLFNFRPTSLAKAMRANLASAKSGR